MKKIITPLLIVSILTLLGCGGSGSSSEVTDPDLSPGTSDAMLNISSILGDTSIVLGDIKHYSATISDPDGIHNVTARVKNETNSDINELPQKKSNDEYTFELDTNGLSAGKYIIEVIAKGNSNGKENYSGPTTRLLNINISLPDAPLEFSEIVGINNIIIGHTFEYTSIISDSDGIEVIKAELKNSSSEIIMAIPYNNSQSNYNFILSSIGLDEGAYTLEITATGVVGGKNVLNNNITRIIEITLIAPDAPLLSTEITGASEIILGQSENYTITLSDDDGIDNVTARLIDSLNTTVRLIPYSKNSDNYSFILTTEDLAEGNYTLDISATGIIGGPESEDNEINKSFNITLIKPDAPLSISEISGSNQFISGQTTQYTAQIADEDGIDEIQATLKNKFDEIVKTLTWEQLDSSYTFTLDTAGLPEGKYHLEVVAKGIDGGVGENSNTLTASLETLSLAPNYFTFNAWIGSDNTDFVFNEAQQGMEFYRSNENECDIENYSACLNGEMDLISSSIINDKTLTHSMNSFLQFNNENHISPITKITTKSFPARSGHQIVNFKNKLWVIGGRNIDRYNDVWSSRDGKNWEIEKINTEFSPRINHRALVFDNKIWLIGGNDGELKNDVWSSSDGKIWERITSSAGFSPRERHQAVVFKNKMWVIGGDDIYDNNNLSWGINRDDVWSSIDGKQWVLENPSAAFYSRAYQQVVMFKNKLWMVQGTRDGEEASIWSSADGIDWKAENTADNLPIMYNQHLSTFKGKLILIPRYSYATNFWTSSDGINWVKEEFIDQPSLLRSGYKTIGFNDRLWIIGGGSQGEYKSSSLSSPDGLNWKQESTSAPFSPRYNHQSLEFNNKLWVIGGYDGTFSPEIWSSNTGLNWTLEAKLDFLANKSQHFKSIAFNNKIWIIGGYGNKGIWSSVDGKVWIKQVDIPPFGDRSSHQLVVFKNKLWLIGGLSENERTGSTGHRVAKNDIWSTLDGINWTEEVPSAGFSPTYSHQVAVFKSKLWLSGGYNNDDIWSSTDGIEWTEEANSLLLLYKRRDFQVLEANNKLWLIGGHIQSSDDRSDVWSTTDGIDWLRETSSAAFSARSKHQAIKFNDKIFIIGGRGGRRGSDYGRDIKNDIWASKDGIDWKLAYKGVISMHPKN